MNKEKKSYIPKNNVLQYAPRRKNARHFLRNSLIIFGVFLVLIGSFLAFVFFSNYFKVLNVVVSGNRLADSATAIRVAEDYIKNNSRIAGLFGPQNILFWFLGTQTQNFSGSSEISHIEINIEFSKRLVYVGVTERDVSYIMCRPAESICYGITKDGIIFSQIPRVEGGLMFKIDDEANIPAVIGEQYFGDPAFLEVVYKTNQLLINLGMRPVRVVVRDHALYDWDAIFSHGPVFHFSGQFVPTELLSVIESIKKQANLDSLEYVDFRAENKVYYR